MANKYKQRRRQLRQSQPESGYFSESGPITPSVALPSPLSASVEAPPSGLLKYAIAAMLFMAVWMIYAQTARHDFTVCDDNVYIFENPAIEQGVTRPLLGQDGLFSDGLHGILTWVRWDAFVYAYTDSHAGNWHPLTWVTHMLDWQLYGHWSHEQQKYVDSWPGGHHQTNMIIHILNTIILFFALRNMTGTQWASAAVAMLFAVHPLRAESVAWSAERKDVLCGFFWMLTMLCYSYYVRRPPIDWSNRTSILVAVVWSVGWYFATWAMLWFALMSKSMAVTLPCVLFLLDFWPLNRLANRFADEYDENESILSRLPWIGLKVGILALEKLPFLVHVAWVCLGTIVGQNKGVALNSFDALPMWMRLVNMSLAYVAYIGQTFWPANMAPFYTHLGMIPMDPTNPIVRHSMTPEVILSSVVAAICLILITMGTITLAFAKSYRWLAIGWFWYLGTMVPVIGIMQVGTQSRADRYTYLPTIGIAIMFVWSIRAAVQFLPVLRNLLTPCVALFTGILISLAWLQVSYWKTSYTLFEHAVKVTDKNFFAYNHLGIAFDKDSKDSTFTLTNKHRAEFDHMGIPYDKANPDENLSLTIDQRHALADLSAKNFAETLKIKPDYDFGNNNLGVYFANKNDLENAAKYFERALQCNDRYADVYNNLGVLYRIQADKSKEKGRLDLANDYLQKSLARHLSGLKVRQDKASDYNNVAQTYHELGQDDKAIEMANQALLIDPSFVAAHLSLAEFYFATNQLKDAEKHLAKALEMDRGTLGQWCQWVLALVGKGERKLAKAATEEVLKFAPKLPLAYDILSQLAADDNNYDEAIAYSMKASEFDPKNPLHLCKVGAIEFLRKNVNGAIKALQAALAIDQNCVPAHLTLAQILFSTKAYKESIEQFQIVVRLEPNNANNWFQLGMAFLNLGDIASAAEVAKKLEALPNFVGGHELKGQVFTAQKKYDEAIAEFRKAIALEPDNAGGHYLIATPFWESGHHKEAIEALEEAVRKDPKNADYKAKLESFRKEGGGQ